MTWRLGCVDDCAQRHGLAGRGVTGQVGRFGIDGQRARRGCRHAMPAVGDVFAREQRPQVHRQSQPPQRTEQQHGGVAWGGAVGGAKLLGDDQIAGAQLVGQCARDAGHQHRPGRIDAARRAGSGAQDRR